MNGNGKVRINFVRGHGNSWISYHLDGRVIVAHKNWEELGGKPIESQHRQWASLSLRGKCYVAFPLPVLSQEELTTLLNERENLLNEREQQLEALATDLQNQEKRLRRDLNAIKKTVEELARKKEEVNTAARKLIEIRAQFAEIASEVERLARKAGERRFASNLLEGIPSQIQPLE